MNSFVLESDIVRTKISGVITGARVISEKVTEDGGYQVTMSVPAYGVGSIAEVAITNKLAKEGITKPEPIPTPAKEAVKSYVPAPEAKIVGQWAEKEMEKRQIKAVNPFKDIEPTEQVTVEQVSLIPDELERSNDETSQEEYDKLKEKMLASNPALYKLIMDCEEKRKKL